MANFRPQNQEKAITLLVQLDKEIDVILGLNEQLNMLILNEETLIRNSDLNSLELLVLEKNEIGNHLTKKLENFQDIYQTFVRSLEINENHNAISLSTLIDCLEHLKKDLLGHALASKVLLHQIEKVEPKLDLLRKTFMEIKPKVEANNYLTRKLLDHHRQTYRFWQDVARESSSTYNPKGQTQISQTSPMLRLKT